MRTFRNIAVTAFVLLFLFGLFPSLRGAAADSDTIWGLNNPTLYPAMASQPSFFSDTVWGLSAPTVYATEVPSGLSVAGSSQPSFYSDTIWGLTNPSPVAAQAPKVAPLPQQPAQPQPYTQPSYNY